MLSLNPLFFDSVESQPGDLCRKLYTQIAQMVEEAYLVQMADAEPGLPHIFYFDHMKARLVNGVPQLPNPPYTTRDAVVNVNTGSFLSSGNDLLSRLTDVMGLYSEPQGPQQELEFNAILEPSQVLAFQLSHGSSYVGGYYQASAHATHDGFRFPTSFFLDQFLMQNVETALQLRDARLGMLADIRQCQGRRGLLTRFEVRVERTANPTLLVVTTEKAFACRRMND
ncbi:uncharacterized protein SCHCODRAFT_02628609 [Schizophyllum commune H4-8]|uniref:uncharacterized protein n=1 Tax=Schizophyllum commune (strain H4-8 / FGSC 9210) TaxID=578458 RepID=UPI00215E0AC6|nr:uncharacterized protein SCHCODRAFT_02628609 [Schizophyllum commune H4-8]KAI5891280.1 hypothetical protein SCHCODRAFT_02628609 [Schizophyllum commune H4-8]